MTGAASRLRRGRGRTLPALRPHRDRSRKSAARRRPPRHPTRASSPPRTPRRRPSRRRRPTRRLAAPSAYPAPPAAPAPAPAPGRFRKKLIEMLGGKADAPQPPADRSYSPKPTADLLAPAPLPAPPQPAYTPQPLPPLAQSGPRHQMLTPAYVPAEVAPDDDGATRAMRGADLAKLKVPSHLVTLQILDQDGQWQPWSTVGAGGLKVGRGERNARFPELNSMATRHLKLSFDGRKLLAEDMGSLNGVYLKLTRPVELRDGARFRVGARIVEFRKADPLPTRAAAVRGGRRGVLERRTPAARLPRLHPARRRAGPPFPDHQPRPHGPRPRVPAGQAGRHRPARRRLGQRATRPGPPRRRPVLPRRPPGVATAPSSASTPRPRVPSGSILLVGRVLLRVVDSAGR